MDLIPESKLLEIAQKLEIDLEAFPKKTTMWINENSIVVSKGYGVVGETIFTC